MRISHKATALGLAAGAALIGAVSGAQAQTVVNGSFEASNPATWPGYANQPGNEVPGWTLSDPAGGGVNPTTDPNQPCCGPGPFGPGAPGVTPSPDGGNWAFMQGAITFSQFINDLTAGQLYQLSYYDSHRQGDSGPGDTLTASIAGATLTTTPDLTWNQRTLQFTASSTSEQLTFTHGLIGGDRSVAFDGVAITLIPEPASLGLLALGGVALLARRRRGA